LESFSKFLSNFLNTLSDEEQNKLNNEEEDEEEDDNEDDDDDDDHETSNHGEIVELTSDNFESYFQRKENLFVVK
jgi:hypothetical protein